jgi:hypothetical protein
MGITRERVVTEFFEGQATRDIERMKKIMHPDLHAPEPWELPYGDYTLLKGFEQIMVNIGSKFELTVESWSFIDMWAFADDGRVIEIAPHLLEPDASQALHNRALVS